MNGSNEMPATVLPQTLEERHSEQGSRAAQQWKTLDIPCAHCEPLEDGVVSIHEAVVLVLRRM